MQKTALAALWVILFISACHQHTDDSHSHDDTHAHDHHASSDDRPALSYTIWTDKTELFVEFPALVVGKDSRFAAHFSYMSNFKPVTEGSVKVSLTDQSAEQTVDNVSAPGIFRPTITPQKAGSYTLTFYIRTAELTDTIRIDDVKVYGSEMDAIALTPQETENPNEISFLKEQAWKMPFANAPVTSGTVYDVIRTGGRLTTTNNSRATVPASTGGIVIYAQPDIVVGSTVKKGQHLFTIAGGDLAAGNIKTEFLQAKSNFDKAEAKYERNKTLFENKAISQADFEIVTNEYDLAKATYENLAANYTNGGKKISAPMSGYIQELPEDNGAYVSLGEPLAMITQNEDLILVAQVNPSDHAKLNGSTTANFTVNGKSYDLEQLNGRLLSYGKSTTAAEPGILVQFSLKNTMGLLPGSFAEVWIKNGPVHDALLMPVEGLLEEYGNYYAIVQTSGEGFEKRPIEIGVSDGRNVEVLSGLEVDERVVTVGAYQVKMAGMSGQAPAHGHAH